MTQIQRRFFRELDKIPETGKFAGRHLTLHIYHELFDFAQCSGPWTTICSDTAKILTAFGFKVAPDGIGWTVKTK